MLAVDPRAVFTTPSRWQSRPLYVLSGTVLGAPFGSFADDAKQRLRAAYVGFVLFNVLALAWAVVLFETLLVESCGVFVTRVLAMALLANDVVKGNVWSPHLQMLNVVPPLLLLTGVLLAGPLASMTAQRRHVLRGALLSLVLAWTAWQVPRPGPWSFHTTAWRAGAKGVHPVTIGAIRRDAINALRRERAGCDWPAA